MTAGYDCEGATRADVLCIEESDLRDEVEGLFDRELAGRMRPGCKPIMDMHKASGMKCIICTSSW